MKNISRDELLRLYRAVKPFAASSFSSSTSRFEVMIRYTLWKDKPGQLDMRTNAGQPEGEMPTAFRRKAATSTDFHPKNGKVWVLLDFQVSPKASTGATNDYSAYELKDFPSRN